jgi:hypothetical protein
MTVTTTTTIPVYHRTKTMVSPEKETMRPRRMQWSFLGIAQQMGWVIGYYRILGKAPCKSSKLVRNILANQELISTSSIGAAGVQSQRINGNSKIRSSFAHHLLHKAAVLSVVTVKIGQTTWFVPTVTNILDTCGSRMKMRMRTTTASMIFRSCSLQLESGCWGGDHYSIDPQGLRQRRCKDLVVKGRDGEFEAYFGH